MTTRPANARRRSGQRGPDEPTSGSDADLTPPADPESVVRTIVLTALTAAPRSRAQLEERLAAKDAPPDVVARVLDRFEEVGLVDDAAFARSLVRTKQAGRGLAGRALRQELRRSGVDDETAAEALEEVDPEMELATARQLVAKRLPSTRGVPHSKRMARLSGMLARKGYPSGVAFRVVREALTAESSAGEDGDGISDEL
ncbi:MAG: regulatory protein RecX [Actinomycetales bacterium]